MVEYLYFQKLPDGLSLNLLMFRKRLKTLGLFIRDIDEMSNKEERIQKVVLEISSLNPTNLTNMDLDEKEIKKLERLEKEVDDYLKTEKIDQDVLFQAKDSYLIMYIEEGLQFIFDEPVSVTVNPKEVFSSSSSKKENSPRVRKPKKTRNFNGKRFSFLKTDSIQVTTKDKYNKRLRLIIRNLKQKDGYKHVRIVKTSRKGVFHVYVRKTD